MPGLCAISSTARDWLGSSRTRESRVSALAAYARGSKRTSGVPSSSGATSSQVCLVRRAVEQITVSGT
jgi:hypothetical protein